MRKSRTTLDGLRMATGGLFLMAVATLALQALRVFKTWMPAELGFIAVNGIGWVLVFLGARRLVKGNYIWKRMPFVAVLAGLCLLGEGLMALRNIRSGMLEQSFVDFTVMFFLYLVLLCLFYTYRLALRNTAEIVKGSDAKLARRCMRSYKPACSIFMVTLIIIPISGIFSSFIEYISTGVVGIIGFLMQVYMCKLLLDGFNVASGNGAVTDRKTRAVGRSKGGRTAKEAKA